MTYPINTSASIVVECDASLGLERRLRRYERVGRVVGSWPDNAQMLLLIRHAQSLDSDKDLDFASVPETPPGFILQLYHCSRPGKWQKRWITLLQDGHMVASKKPASSSLEKHCQRLCHLSACDIYTAANEEAAATLDHRKARSPRNSPVKSLKPPKKYVLAVKCQIRPTTQHDMDNYVQYFCTEDPAVASRFHDMVHAWRSWYMVKVHRESQRRRSMDAREADPAPQITPVKHTPVKSFSYLKVSSGHKVKVSRDDTPYTIGEMGDQPLLDMDRFEKPLEEYGKDWIKIQRQSRGSPITPGTTDSGVSLTTPSTGGDLDGKDGLDCASPSEERRRRLDMKKLITSSGTVDTQLLTTKDTTGVTISISESPPEQPSAPPLPKPEILPWLPSASEHTAKLRADQVRNSPAAPQRPATSSGPMGRHSLQPAGDNRRRRHNHRAYPSLPPQQAALWREASKWADDRASQNLEPFGPSVGQRLMASRPSMSALNSSSAVRRGGTSTNCPAIWREPATRPSTSGGERASRISRVRSASSGGSVRRGSGAQPGEPLPPMPNVPAHLRPAARDAKARAAAGLSAPNMANGARGWVARPSI